MRSALIAALALGLVACRDRAAPGRAGAPAAQGADAAPAVPFQVREASSDLVFFWFDERGTAHPAARVAEVPDAHRDVVRVDPPRPDQRVPGWVYVADLRRAGADGAFPVRAVRSEELARGLASINGLGAMGTPRLPHEPAARPSDPAVEPAAAQVIIYGASWCGACHQAAAYLRSRRVAFVEKDIEQDPAAAREMTEKARRAGIPTGSIPILDVRGRILQGFSPPAIDQALAGG